MEFTQKMNINVKNALQIGKDLKRIINGRKAGFELLDYTEENELKLTEELLTYCQELDEKLNKYRKSELLRTLKALEIIAAIIDWDSKLGIIKKKNLIGTKIEMVADYAPAHAYKYAFVSDYVNFEYKKTGWSITNFGRCDTRCYKHKYKATLSNFAREDILEDFCNNTSFNLKSNASSILTGLNRYVLQKRMQLLEKKEEKENGKMENCD